MRLPASTVIAAMLLASGAPPALAFTAATPPGAGDGALRATPADDQGSDRDSFSAKAKAEMHEWQLKFDAAAKTAKAKGEEGSTAASRQLDVAWAKTKDASKRLQSASAAGWDSAKAGFEKASHNLAAAWDKVYPGTK